MSATTKLLSPRQDDFDALLAEGGIDPALAADILVNLLPRLKRRGLDVDSLSRDLLQRVLREHKEGRLVRAAAKEALAEALEDSRRDVQALLASKRRTGVGEPELRRRVRESFEENRAAPIALPEARRRFLMGRIMDRLRFEVEGREVSKWLSEYLDKK